MASFFAPILGFFAGLFGLGGAFAHTAPLPAHSVTVQTNATSSQQVTIVTDINGQKETRVLQAPHGFKSSVVTRSVNGHTTTEASTTPLTDADIRNMQAQEEQMERHMQQMAAAQQSMFENMWSNF